MRLIDADDLIGVIQYNTNYKPNKSAIMADELIRYINSQPTAYDVDKVVKQLRECERYVYDAVSDEDYYVISTEKAIEIVKGAVKDEAMP